MLSLFGHLLRMLFPAGCFQVPFLLAMVAGFVLIGVLFLFFAIALFPPFLGIGCSQCNLILIIGVLVVL
jgi:hypothetical protein